MMQDRTFRGQSADGVWHEGFLIRSPGVKNSRPGEGWYINSEQESAYAHLVKPFTIGMSTGVKDMEGPMVVDAAGIILIVAALPMVGWSWAVSHMAGPKVKNAKEGT